MLKIRRSKPTANFTIIPNGLLRDDRLSYCARGVLAELLSRPSGWETNADALSEQARRHRGDVVGEGRRGLRSAFAELEAAGYMVRSKEKGERGRFVTVLEVFDVPVHRGTAGGTSVDGTSASVTSVSGTSSVRTEGGSSDEEDLLEEGATTSSPAAPPSSAVAPVDDGGGGGVSSSEQNPQAEALVAALDFRGRPPGMKQRRQLVALAAAALDAGWVEQDLKTYLDLGGAAVNSAAAVYAHRLDPGELPDPVTFREAARRLPEGTDAATSGWMAQSRQLGSPEEREHAPAGHRLPSGRRGYSGPARPNTAWDRIAADAANGVSPPGAERYKHCGACDPITRTREEKDRTGEKKHTPCVGCHPSMQFS
ncbi:hypothetical protein [Streptomyces sp. B1I3]|uniref:hypothetical protein n=1 Tax=Streptomyces sp. B1I3 TaxID=3042264 RepID=UPI00278AAE58|nr:hypothetical protein [Streptomyces sp. B1I3]MDQ0792023.1 hypothetical protein [Streptomyces sp. B1I3]